jgi:hypothetical protein
MRIKQEAKNGRYILYLLLQALLAAQSLLATVQSKAITLMQYIYDVKDTVQTFAMSVYGK